MPLDQETRDGFAHVFGICGDPCQLCEDGHTDTRGILEENMSDEAAAALGLVEVEVNTEIPRSNVERLLECLRSHAVRPQSIPGLRQDIFDAIDVIESRL